jgi:hypothetical protein
MLGLLFFKSDRARAMREARLRPPEAFRALYAPRPFTAESTVTPMGFDRYEAFLRVRRDAWRDAPRSVIV